MVIVRKRKFPLWIVMAGLPSLKTAEVTLMTSVKDDGLADVATFR